jgi:membrane-associated phospholipid phosphatase
MATPGMTLRRARTVRSGWLAFALVAIAAFVALAVLVTVWPGFDGLDMWASGLIRATRTPPLTALADFFTFVGSAAVVMPIAALLMLWMALKRNWAAVVYVFMTVAVGWALGNYPLKAIIHRQRPPVKYAIAPITNGYSLPSAHSLGAFLLFTTLCVIVMLNLPTGHHLKRWLAAVSAIIILAVGYSRVYLGVHWFGDVLAAYLFGWAWWSFTTATYFGSVTDEKRVAPRPGAAAG